MLPLAGFATSVGELGVVSVLFWSILGPLALYGFGAWLGVARVEALWARVPLSDPQDIERGMRLFDEHGQKAALLARMVPVVRSAISVPAGVARMPLPRFVALTAVESLGWNAALVLAGRVLGDRWETVGLWATRLSVVVLVGLGVWALRTAVQRLRADGSRRVQGRS